MNLRRSIERLEMTDRHAQEALWLLAVVADVSWFWYSSALYDGHRVWGLIRPHPLPRGVPEFPTLKIALPPRIPDL